MTHVNKHPCLPIPPEQDIPLMKSHPLMQASHQCQKDMWCNLLCATEMKYCFSQGQSLHYVICIKDIYIKRRICIKLYFAVTLNQMTVTMTYTCNMDRGTRTVSTCKQAIVHIHACNILQLFKNP